MKRRSSVLTLALLCSLLYPARHLLAQPWQEHALQVRPSRLAVLDSTNWIAWGFSTMIWNQTVLLRTTDAGGTWNTDTVALGAYTSKDHLYSLQYWINDALRAPDGRDYLFGYRTESTTSTQVAAWAAMRLKGASRWDTVYKVQDGTALSLLSATSRYGLLLHAAPRGYGGSDLAELVRLRLGTTTFTRTLDLRKLPFPLLRVISSSYNSQGERALVIVQDSQNTLHLLRSTDSGGTWSVSSGAALPASATQVAATGRRWVVLTAHEIYSSLDFGDTWHRQVQTTDSLVSVTLRGRLGYALPYRTDYGYVSMDSGATWVAQSFPHTLDSYTSVEFAGETKLVASFSAGNYTTKAVRLDTARRAVLHFKSRDLTLGLTHYDDTSHVSLVAYNIGEADLHIDSLSSKTGLTSISALPASIPPHDSLRIDLAYFTNSYSPINDTIQLHTNTEATREELRLSYQAHYASLRIYDERLIYSLPDEETIYTPLLYNDGTDTLQIVGVRALGSGLKVDSVASRIAPLRTANTILTIASRGPGNYSESIVIESTGLERYDTLVVDWIVPRGNLVKDWDIKTTESTVSDVARQIACSPGGNVIAAAESSEDLTMTQFTPTSEKSWSTSYYRSHSAGTGVDASGHSYTLIDSTNKATLKKLDIDGTLLWSRENYGGMFGKELIVAPDGRTAVNMETYSVGHAEGSISTFEPGDGYIEEVLPNGSHLSGFSIHGSASYRELGQVTNDTKYGLDQATAIALGSDSTLFASVDIDSSQYERLWSTTITMDSIHHQYAVYAIGNSPAVTLTHGTYDRLLPTADASFYARASSWYRIDRAGKESPVSGEGDGVIIDGDLVTYSSRGVVRCNAEDSVIWSLPLRLGSTVVRGAIDRSHDLYLAGDEAGTILLAKVGPGGDVITYRRYAVPSRSLSTVAIALDSTGTLYLSVTETDTATHHTEARLVRMIEVPGAAVRKAVEGLPRIDVQPNPVYGAFKVTAPFEIARVTLRDLLGRMVAIDPSGKDVDTHAITAGVYFVEVDGRNGERAVARVVVK